KLFHDYGPLLLRAIRKRLTKRIRSKFDSTDFAQDVWASFYARERDNCRFQSPEDLLAFLTKVAHNKVAEKTRQPLKLQKYNVTREQSMDDSTKFDRERLIGNQPTPSYIAMSQEEWNEFLRKQPLVYRRIFILLREGKTRAEIAEEIGISVRTVQR